MRRSPYYRKLSPAARVRRLRRQAKATCKCGGWPFPHRAGSKSNGGDMGCYHPGVKW
jgi:hypothetical protein